MNSLHTDSKPLPDVVAKTTTNTDFASHEQVEIGELKNRFSVWSTIGVQYSITATPLAIGSYLAFVQGVGGFPFFVYCFIVVAIGQTLLCLSMAEIAAVFPHTSGQVYWTAALAPPGWARSLSWINGAATSAGWLFATAGTFLFTAQLWVAAAAVYHRDYQIENYHIYLLVLAIGLISIVFNIWLLDYYPRVTKFMVVFINAATIYVLVALLARAHPKASARTVFVDIINETGWDSLGIVFMMGFLPGFTSLACLDVATHLTEELPRPERQVPQVMMITLLLSIFTGFPMILVYCFSTVTPENLLEPVGDQPIFQLYYDALDSVALTVITLVIYCIVYLSSCPAVVTTTSRLIWTFAKHNGLPFPRQLSYVQPKTQIPTIAVYATTLVACLICLVQFGSATVLNGVFGAGSVCFFFSYGMPVWLLLARGRKMLPKKRYFNLGRAGPLINALTVAWQVLSVVFLCFPQYRPVTLDSMNWSSLWSVVSLVIFFIGWFTYSRKHYEAPKPLYIPSLHGPRPAA